MKKILLSYLLVGFTVFCAFAQEDINTNKDSKRMPEIYFEETTHDFGTIEYNGNGTCEFTFKNKGKEPLLLTSVVASCGCTTPTWPKEPIKRGKKGTIVVKYNTRIRGAFSKSIRVRSNAKTSLVTLKLKGTVKNPETPKTNN